MRIKNVILLCALFLITPFFLFPQNPVATKNILHRVFMIKYGDWTGTAFTIEVDSRQYLVTAKHVVEGIKRNDVIEIFQDNRWKYLKVTNLEVINPSIDISVFAAKIQLSPTYPVIPSAENLVLSQQVFFLGFPFGMSMDAKDNNNFPLPFVKSGIVSAMVSEKERDHIIYVDGHNNKGFSGGPVVFFERGNRNMHVASVVSAYRGEFGDIYKDTTKLELKAITNAGIMITYNIVHAVEVIKNEPIGFVIKKE